MIISTEAAFIILIVSLSAMKLIMSGVETWSYKRNRVYTGSLKGGEDIAQQRQPTEKAPAQAEKMVAASLAAAAGVPEGGKEKAP